ncbi:hypothetical protein FD754_019082 [Muntiacus muntjak]|uniref:LIM interaction domain-containing protein n=1 Tax=Muntiacus muntjak TaxID=9888 RepID=A0A5N3UZ80_MUNMU|nr:hypothetical protein FD754_019082 [Muntiacus muntjak]
MACVYFPQYRSQNVELLELIYGNYTNSDIVDGHQIWKDDPIGRTLIPRYFSTVFEGGVTDLYYILKHSKESYHNSSITVDCDQCAMVTQHGKPMFTKVCTEGRLILEFTFDDLMRIKTWHFTIRQYRELVPRSILAMHAQDPQVLDQLSKNITRMGLTNFTLNYLRQHSVYVLNHSVCVCVCVKFTFKLLKMQLNRKENSSAVESIQLKNSKMVDIIKFNDSVARSLLSS